LDFFPKGKLFLLNLSSATQSLEIFGAPEVPVSYFANLFGLNNWINMTIEKEELNGPTQRNSAAQKRKKPARPT
jgi:hypothetical protein